MAAVSLLLEGCLVVLVNPVCIQSFWCALKLENLVWLVNQKCISKIESNVIRCLSTSSVKLKIFAMAPSSYHMVPKPGTLAPWLVNRVPGFVAMMTLTFGFLPLALGLQRCLQLVLIHYRG